MPSKRPPLDEQKSLWEATIAAEGITTAPGAAAGNSFIDAGLALSGANSFVSMLAVLYPGQPRLVDSFDITGFNNATGEVTLSTAYKGVAAAIPAGVPYKIVTFRFVPAEVAALTAALAVHEAFQLTSRGVVDNIILDTQIRKVQSGIKAIDAAATKYLHIDSGTNGAEILSIAIEGVISHDWTLDVYVPAADGEAATAPQSKRNAIIYAAADTEGGLLGPFGIPFDGYLDFTNNGVNDQIDQVTITYRSRGALALTWEA